MDVKTLRAKSAEALAKELTEALTHERALGFKLAANQLKNVREARKTRLQIARLKTLLREQR